MKTDTIENGLEAHITKHLCLVNAFEERYFSHYNRVDCVDEDFTASLKKASLIKTKAATIYTSIAKAKLEIELTREYKVAMIAEVVMGKRKLNFAH